MVPLKIIYNKKFDNMNLVNLLKNLLNFQKKIDLSVLPSLGLFYKSDFEITIKKADLEDIIEYEHNYVKDDLGSVISKLKKIVIKNTLFSNNYDFEDIKSIDVVFIFLEIVKFTKGKPISFIYVDSEYGVEDVIEFGPSYFNYFQIDDDIMKFYNSVERQFNIDDYKFTLPSIGIENCLTNFLISKSNQPDAIRYNKFNYDFTYFLADKKKISFSEIDNLIHIFNFDMDDVEKGKVQKIVKMFQPIQKYALRKGSRVIEINSQIDLENIWK